MLTTSTHKVRRPRQLRRQLHDDADDNGGDGGGDPQDNKLQQQKKIEARCKMQDASRKMCVCACVRALESRPVSQSSPQSPDTRPAG